MSRTCVSVVVPTRDRPALLRQALESIRALEGDDLSFEILVGDNGSTAEIKEIAETAGARYFKVERHGAGAARNAGLRAATGDFVAFLDDDDVWLPGNIRTHLALLAERPELDGVLGQIVCTDQSLNRIMPTWPATSPGEGDDLVRAMLSGYYPQLAGTVVRASAAREIGPFDEALLGDQDWDWHLRLARRRKLGFTPVACVLFRQRAPGSFDALRLSRLGFARRVFLRHAMPEWRALGGAQSVLRAYREVLWQYYQYFTDAAVERAAACDRAAARRAIWGAFRTFPVRAVYHLVAPKPLRGAFFGAVFGRGAAAT
ncbi:MAG: glycosyltransferase family 2 protein [Hyphomonadaceae bacterium]